MFRKGTLMVHYASKMEVGDELDFEDLANLQWTLKELDEIIPAFAPRKYSHHENLMYARGDKESKAPSSYHAPHQSATACAIPSSS